MSAHPGQVNSAADYSQGDKVNILSFVLAIIAIVIFAGAYRGAKWGSVGLGLAILTAAWVLQLIWVTDQITL